MMRAWDACLAIQLMAAYEHEQLPWMRSFSERDLVLAILGHEANDSAGMTCKQLWLTRLAPLSTMQRQLYRLIKCGVIVRRKSLADKRRFHLHVSDTAKQALTSYAQFMQSLGPNDRNSSTQAAIPREPSPKAAATRLAIIKNPPPPNRLSADRDAPYAARLRISETRG